MPQPQPTSRPLPPASGPGPDTSYLAQVIWQGNELVPDVKETLQYFRSLGASLEPSTTEQACSQQLTPPPLTRVPSQARTSVSPPLSGKHFMLLANSFRSCTTPVFVSNNATKSRKQYKTKFDKLGIKAAEVRSHSQPCCLAASRPSLPFPSAFRSEAML